MVPFFAANWEESCTSVFRFGVIGVTEGQFLGMAIELATGIFGPGLWKWRIFGDVLQGEWCRDWVPWMTVYHAVITCGLCGGTYQVVSSLWTVWKYYKAHPQESREQATTSFVQFFSVVFLGAIWSVAPSGVMLRHPRVLLSIIGALCSYQASRLIICHTTGERYKGFWKIIWPLPMVVFNDWSGRLLGKSDSDTLVDSSLAIWFYAAYVMGLYAHFILVTINQITTFLGIRCFHIKPIVKEAPPLADPLSEDPTSPKIVKKVYGKGA
jgi:hypothetical protein